MNRVLTMVVVILMVMVACCGVAFAADWTEFGTDGTNNSITDAKTPTSESEAELVFKVRVKDTESWDANSNILIVDDFVYVGTGSNLLKLDKDGNEEAKATLTAPMSSFAPYIAYGDGKIFAYVNDGTDGYVEAVDAATMQRVWVSEKMEGMNGFSPITYANGNIFMAVSGYDWSGYVPMPGYVIGMTTSDDDTGSQDEVKGNAFAYNGSLSYYWNGPAVSGNIAIVGSVEGTLQTIDTKTGAMIDEQDLGQGIKTTVTYVDGKAYFGTADGLARINVAADGTIDDASLKLLSLGAQTTSTPVVSGGRVYVGTGDLTGGTGFYTVDAETMTSVYSKEIPGVDGFTGNDIAISGIQSTPVLTTAYSDTYVYFSINAKPGGVVMLKDSPGQTTADVTTIYTPEDADQNSTVAEFVVDEDGRIYYTNDSGYLFAVGKAAPAPVSTDGGGNPDTGQRLDGMVLLFAGALILGAVGIMLMRKAAAK